MELKFTMPTAKTNLDSLAIEPEEHMGLSAYANELELDRESTPVRRDHTTSRAYSFFLAGCYEVC